MKILKRIGIAAAALVVAYCAVAGTLYLFGFRIYRLSTSSMQPTIQKDEWVIGRLSEPYKSRVRRLDIVLYRPPHAPGKIFIKRVAALSGERVVIDQDEMTVDGKKVRLPYPVVPLSRSRVDMTVPAGSIFLVGDNTSNAMDSRYHGAVPLNDVLGYLVFKR